MIINKAELTEEEQEQLKNAKSKIDIDLIQLKAQQRYILSFSKDINMTCTREGVPDDLAPILKLSDSDSEKVRQAILSDVKEILQSVTRKDHIEYVQRISAFWSNLGMIFEGEPAKSFYNEPCYLNCFSFLCDILDNQSRAYDYYRLGGLEIHKLAKKKAAEWYEPPTPPDSKKKGTVKRNSFIEHLINTANPTFLTTRQTRAMNDYPARAKEGDNMNFDIFGNANIADGDYLCNIVEYDKLANLRPSVKQALFLLVSIFTFSGAKSLEDNLSLDDYMTIRELKDKKTARKRFEEDMNLILNSTVSYDKERKVTDKDGNVKVYKSRIGGFNLLQDWNWTDSKKNMITFKFTEIFFKILKHSTIMNLPISYYKINSNNNPASCDFLLKISILKNYNIGKDNENIISVDTLLKSTRAIPTKERVDEMDRNTAARIIEPFERDMNALQEAFDWHYCHPHSGGKELTDEELESLDFDTFSRLMIKIDWKDYPDQTERLERQAERIAENKEKKKQREKAKSKKKVGE